MQNPKTAQGKSPLPVHTLPIDDLETGMKPAAVHELVGRPDSAAAGTGAGGEDAVPGTAEPWVYTDEVIDPLHLAFSVVLAPALLLLAPFIAIGPKAGILLRRRSDRGVKEQLHPLASH